MGAKESRRFGKTEEEEDVNRRRQREGLEKLKAMEEERGKWEKGSERWKEKMEAWQPPKLGYLTPHSSRPSGQLTAISSMR